MLRACLWPSRPVYNYLVFNSLMIQMSCGVLWVEDPERVEMRDLCLNPLTWRKIYIYIYDLVFSL